MVWHDVAQKKRLPKDSRSCDFVIDYRTFIEDWNKLVEFTHWLKEHQEAKAKFETISKNQ